MSGRVSIRRPKGKQTINTTCKMCPGSSKERSLLYSLVRFKCSQIFNSSENWMGRKALCESRSSNFPTPPLLDLLTACPKILSSHTRQLLDPATPLSSKHRDPSRSIL